MKTLMLLGAALSAALGTTSLIDSGYPPGGYQGNNQADVIFTDQATINKLCGPLPEGASRIYACSLTPGRKMVLPNPCSGEFAGQFYSKLLCHELGHVNGWPGDHPRP